MEGWSGSAAWPRSDHFHLFLMFSTVKKCVEVTSNHFQKKILLSYFFFNPISLQIGEKWSRSWSTGPCDQITARSSSPPSATPLLRALRLSPPHRRPTLPRCPSAALSPPSAAVPLRLIAVPRRLTTTTIYFRGQKIWKVVVQDLLVKGLSHAKKDVEEPQQVRETVNGVSVPHDSFILGLTSRKHDDTRLPKCRKGSGKAQKETNGLMNNTPGDSVRDSTHKFKC